MTFAILDPAGDTVQTVTGPATPGLHRAYWNLQLPSGVRELSPSERRDSVLVIRRMREIADSLIAGGTETEAEAVEQAVTMLSSGDMSALRRAFGGGGSAGEFRERPGESYPAGEREEGGDRRAVSEAARTISRAVRSYARTLRSGYNPIGRGWGGPPPAYALPGSYTVHGTLGGTTLRQNLLVERAAGFPAIAPPPAEAWERALLGGYESER